MSMKTWLLFCLLASVTLAIRNDRGKAPRPKVHLRKGGEGLNAPDRRDVAKRQVSTCTNGYENVQDSTMCLTDSPNYVAGSAGISAADKALIVQKHNAYRAAVSPTAKQLEKMYWDDELAAVAEKWAKQCYVGHESGLGKSRFIPPYGMNPGQNGAFGYGNWDKAVTGWFNESFDFIYGQDVGFSKIGHYTQMVQDGSILVGCGYAKCSTGYQHFYFCNYLGPQYNYIKPYADGSSCSACPSQCSNNLCDCGGTFCFNGGTLDLNTCQCSCPSNFGGPKCLGGSSCSGVVCQNGGTLNSATCVCSCPSGYTGNLCQTASGCSGVVCQNGGTLNSATCVCACPSGYTGNLCETAAPCSGKVCQNGGTLNTASCTCSCASGFTGNSCETAVNPPSNCPAAGDPWYCKYWDQSDCSYSNVLADCPYKCGTCQACNGLTCENNGWIDPSACSCGCHAIYTGARCQTKSCPSADPWYCGAEQFFPPSDCQVYANVQYDCPNMCGLHCP